MIVNDSFPPFKIKSIPSLGIFLIGSVNEKLKYLEIRNKIELINDNINKQLSTILIDDSALKNKLLFDFENELRVALELEKNKSQDEIQKELNKERISKESQVNNEKLKQYLE